MENRRKICDGLAAGLEAGFKHDACERTAACEQLKSMKLNYSCAASSAASTGMVWDLVHSPDFHFWERTERSGQRLVCEELVGLNDEQVQTMLTELENNLPKVVPDALDWEYSQQKAKHRG